MVTNPISFSCPTLLWMAFLFLYAFLNRAMRIGSHRFFLISWRLCVGIVLFILPFELGAWGERGHQAICKTAAHTLARELGYGSKQERSLGRFFERWNMALGHLCNIPDIQWRDEDAEVVKEFHAPLHFFNIEIFLGPLKMREEDAQKIRELPKTYKALLQKFEAKPSALDARPIDVLKAGVAPWRVGQIYDLMRESLSRLRPGKQDQTKEARDFLIQSGIMGHYVGDLSQPLHVTLDYDGVVEGQGGIHTYFESEVLNTYDAFFEADLEVRVQGKSFQDELRRALRINESKNPTAWALNLAAESYQKKDSILELDQKASLLKRGSRKILNRDKVERPQMAERKNPRDPLVKRAYRQVHLDQLAVAAFLLKEIIFRAWVESGKPDLSKLGDISYPLQVDFIPPPK